VLQLSGQGGDDKFYIDEAGILTHSPHSGPGTTALDGGTGDDSLRITGCNLAELFEIKPGEADNSVEIGVTDIASGVPTANLHVVDTEDVAIKGGDGDDEFHVFGPLLTALHLFGQGGDDADVIHVLFSEGAN